MGTGIAGGDLAPGDQSCIEHWDHGWRRRRFEMSNFQLRFANWNS
jgi:hypothetical protein